MAKAKNKPDIEFPKMLTCREVAQILRLSSRTVSNWLSDGLIPCVRIGKKWLVSVDTVRRIVAGEIKIKLNV